MNQSTRAKTRRMAGMALFMAIIVILQIVASFVKFGPFAVSLVLIPIVVGAALYGPMAGTVFGLTFGVVVLIASITGLDLGGNMLWASNPLLTAVLIFVKGGAAGLAAGWVYRLLAKRHVYVGVLTAAVVCPVVNTGIFLAAMTLFNKAILAVWQQNTAGYADKPLVYYLFIGIAGVNFLFELITNIILSPAAVRIIHAVRRN